LKLKQQRPRRASLQSILNVDFVVPASVFGGCATPCLRFEVRDSVVRLPDGEAIPE
jgi:hypothetical protein